MSDDNRPMVRLDLYSHHIKVTGFDVSVQRIVLEFCRTMAEYGQVRKGNRFVRELLRTYAARTQDSSEIRLHINQLDEFKRHLIAWGVPEALISITRHALYTPVKVDFPLHDTREPRAEQLPIIEYLAAPVDFEGAPSKVVTLQTGKGKTFLSLYALRKLGVRTVLVIKGGFLEKWVSDIQEAYGFESPPYSQNAKTGEKTYKVVPGGDLLAIKGASDLHKLMTMAVTGELTAKFIIITGKTLFNYYKTYEIMGVTELYPAKPEHFYEMLGVGVRLIDEVHMEFHANFRQDLYTHVPLTLSLSATLDSDNRMTNRMFRLTWPNHSRAPEAEYHRYISCMAVWYNIAELKNVRTMGPMRQYSHIHFEQSLMRSPRMLKAYTDMIIDLVEKAFIQHRQPGQKMLVFCARTELCTLLRDMMRKRWPTLTINRYVQEDSFDKILEADLTVSTILSAGTAIDIPNLRTVLMTTMINSKQSNIQVLGRLRVLRDYPDVMPQFLFLAARNIEKHREYTKAKQEKLKGKVLHFNELESPYIV